MTFVNDSRSGLETCPQLLAQLFSDGTDLTPLLMQLLQLVESGNRLCLRTQFLDSLTQGGFQFQVLLEVVIPELIIDLDDVVELLAIHLIGFPQIVDMLLWDVLDLFPFLLDLLESVVLLVEIILAFGKLFQLVDKLEFAGIVLRFLFLIFRQGNRLFLLIGGEQLFQLLFLLVGWGYEILFFSSIGEELFLHLFRFNSADLVIGLL